jgi:hypothetical protein
MHTVTRLEGGDWTTLASTAGGLAAHFVVKADKAHRNNSRGAHDSVHPLTGVVWSRWNTSKLGGYPLGPGRRMSDLRLCPWELPTGGLEDQAMHAVFLDHGAKVALIDGVGTTDMSVSPVQWVLIGAIFDISQHAGCLLPQLVMPSSTTSALRLEPVDMARVWKPVLLAANAFHDNRPGLSLSVVDTKDSFAMIPMIAGRMSAHAIKLEGAIQAELGFTKRVILDALADLVIHLGPPPEVEVEDLTVPQSEFWISATKIPRYTTDNENFEEVTTLHAYICVSPSLRADSHCAEHVLRRRCSGRVLESQPLCITCSVPPVF